MNKLRYPWPASALRARDMSMLYRAREHSPTRTTISKLLAQAVRKTYGHLAPSSSETVVTRQKEAA